ncbi:MULTISPECIES: pyridoxal-dependent decarboxylase [unclassified Microbulbifer]|uniref:pyridoxal phosphate-dependent decarboxylase family protein n=1 Tax=unclassified Microbulbifer TaxID=2619833 RepID=UPI0027E45AE8|nr:MULTISPECIES: pyridoxal-dependent decarboxylase [unclassified Microbulbifer]
MKKYGEFLSPYFLGAYGENSDILEKFLIEFIRDHVFWRRNFHPEDVPPINPQMQNKVKYRDAIARMQFELHQLAARLKKSVPVFNPRYVGHMVSETLMPALIAQQVATFYNPNNVSVDAATVTIDMELEVGQQFAQMFGFNTDEEHSPCAWGHLTSGGSSANYESLWNFRAVKFYSLALARTCRDLRLELALEDLGCDMADIDDWRLFNLPIDRQLELRTSALAMMPDASGRRKLLDAIEERRIETLGPVEFFQRMDLKPPVILAPTSAHYSWNKAVRILGFGSRQLIKVPVDEHMRMDIPALQRLLEKLRSDQRPVLAVIGVLGTTEFGTIDPLDQLLAMREQWRTEGLDFCIHVDAAWGGYLTAIFRDEQGALLPRNEVRKHFTYFPSESVYRSFTALSQVDSITVDPHKMGYLPYGTGGFVCRNRDVAKLLTQKAAYVFDEQERGPELNLKNLGQYVLEGSKPGANAAAAYVAHRVLPLDAAHFGRLMGHTIQASEHLYDHLLALAQELKDQVHLILPFEPDTNLICIALNPCGNNNPVRQNAFTRRVFEHLKVDPNKPIQTKEFVGSFTSLFRQNLSEEVALRLAENLGLDSGAFCSEVTDPQRQSDSMFVLRHTIMNPWGMASSNGQTYLEKYCAFLCKVLLEELQRSEWWF